MKIKSKKVYDAPRFKNIREVLGNSVKLYPDCTAFILKEKKENEVTYKNITFTQLQEEVNSLKIRIAELESEVIEKDQIILTQKKTISELEAKIEELENRSWVLMFIDWVKKLVKKN